MLRSLARLGIRGRLILLLLIVIVPILLTEALVYSRRFQGLKNAELQANLELARAAAKTFETFVQGVLHTELSIGVALTASPSPTARERDRLLDLAQSGSTAVRSFFWMQPDGVVVASSVRSYVGFNLQDRSFVQAVLAGRPWVISELIVGRATGKPAFTISRGIRDAEGRLRGIVAAAIEPEGLESVLGTERLVGSGFALVDHKGMLVSRHPRAQFTPEQRNWLKLYPAAMGAALRGEEVRTTVTSPLVPGQRRLAAAAPVPQIGWVATASRDEAEVMHAVTSALLLQAAVVLGVALLGFGAAVALASPLARGIIGLRNRALALGRGESMPAASGSGPPELQELAAAFDQMARDVQTRETAVRDAQGVLRAVLETASDPIYLKDAESRIVMCNPALERIAGKPAAEILGKTDSEYYEDAAVGDTLRAHDLRVMESGRSEVTEETVKTPDGCRTFLSNKAPYRNESGDIIGIVGISHDITNRKLAEEALRLSEEKFAKAFAANPGAVVLTRLADGRILDFNDTFCRMAGYGQAELFGRLSTDLNIWPNPADRAQWVEELRRVGHVHGREQTLLKKSGDAFIVLASVERITLQEEDVGVWTFVDITARKHAEARLRATLAEKEAALADNQALLREVHHRVKNNLQMLCDLMFLQMEAMPDRDQHQDLQDAYSRIYAIARLHEQLYQTMEGGRIRLGDYLARLAGGFAHLFPTVPVKVEAIADGVALDLDRAIHVGLIVNELITNAMKHAFRKGQPGEVTVAVGTLGDEVQLQVRDNGRGLPDDFSLEHAKSVGLRTVYLLAKRLVATVTVANEKGASITITFPREADEPVEPRAD